MSTKLVLFLGLGLLGSVAHADARPSQVATTVGRVRALVAKKFSPDALEKFDRVVQHGTAGVGDKLIDSDEGRFKPLGGGATVHTDRVWVQPKPSRALAMKSRPAEERELTVVKQRGRRADGQTPFVRVLATDSQGSVGVHISGDKIDFISNKAEYHSVGSETSARSTP